MKKKISKLVRAGNSWGNSYIRYESNADRNKILSVEEYLNEIRPYFKHIMNNIKTSETWKNQSTIAINFFLLQINMKNV